MKYKIYIFIFSLYIPALNACEKLEYEEMKDMPKETLIRELCSELQEYKTHEQYSILGIESAASKAQSCLKNVLSMQRILENIHKEKMPTC